MTEETVHTERLPGDIVVVTLDHPPANATDNATIHLLLKTFQDIVADESVRAVIFRGAGDRFFCTGGDFKELRTLTLEAGLDRIRTFQRLLVVMETLPLPLITAINGACVGGGMEFALSGDYSVAVPYARFGFPEINHGLLSDARGMRRVIDLLGLRNARKLLYFGDLFNAEQALEMGIVDEVVESGDLMDRAVYWAGVLGEKSRVHFTAIKNTLARAPTMGDEEFEDMAVRDFQAYFGSKAMFDRLDALMARKKTAASS